MVTSSELSDTGMFPGQKLPEKTMFMQTCGLLRDFLKDGNGSLGLGMALGNSAADSNAAGAAPESRPHPASTPMNNFFPTTMEQSAGLQSWNMATTPRSVKQMNFFQDDDMPKLSDQFANKPIAMEPEKAQMTIFYNGQVIVFNDFPANKANELMLIASMGSSKNSAFSVNPVKISNDSACSIPNSNMEGFQRAPRPIDLPIARKASLTRFLEKRKDRINARASYNTYEGFASPLKPTESKSWLGLSSAQSSSNAV